MLVLKNPWISRYHGGLFAALTLCLSACASAPQTVPNTPLTPDESRVYEHGVDFIATLEGLEGRWRDEWNRDLDVRVGSSDAIAVVTVRTLRTDIDPEQRVTHRIFATVDRVIAGDTRGKEIEMSVRQGVPGFPSVNDNLARVEGGQFVAYLKWFRAEGGNVAAHWHLSPASAQVLAETEGAVARTNEGGESGERTIVHNN